MSGPALDESLRSFDRSLPMALLRAREATMRRFRPILAPHGLTEQQWRVMRALAASERGASASEIADATFLLGPSLSRILAKLEERRLILRRSDPNDQRRALLRLSAEGKRLFDAIAPKSERAYREIEDDLGTGRLGQLMRVLEEAERL